MGYGDYDRADRLEQENEHLIKALKDIYTTVINTKERDVLSPTAVSIASIEVIVRNALSDWKK